ncbi:interferon a3-like [Betta splendens]|uniref:Interferon a3-like n=1 Tax=Betta splendens TaxID=158456 RepID=A0A9W2XGA7_BETSP|nr:interferon a3-like [Betta splendens]
MLSRTLLLCLLAAAFSTGSSLRCKWMDHKFRQCSENCLNLLETMANNSTNTTGHAAVTFPTDLYSQASKASAEDKVGFTVQVLEEVVVLFEEDHSSASWEQVTVENFLSVVTRQAEGLRSCTGSHKKNKKLQMYFKRLSRHVLEQMDHSAESWELIRKQIKTHLMRTDLLISSLLTVN